MFLEDTLKEKIELFKKRNYSKKFITILQKMLEINPKKRPDFIELKKIL